MPPAEEEEQPADQEDHLEVGGHSGVVRHWMHFLTSVIWLLMRFFKGVLVFPI